MCHGKHPLAWAFEFAVEGLVDASVAGGWVLGAWVAFALVLSVPRLPSVGWGLVPLAIVGPLAGAVHRSRRLAGLTTAVSAASAAGAWALWQRPMLWGL